MGLLGQDAPLHQRLGEDRIIATVTPYADAHARFTPAIWNTEEEIDAALRAVGERG